MRIMFNKFLAQLQTEIPEIEVKYKDQSSFMKVLGKILFFNPNFMTNYITTIGTTVYFPTEEFVLGKETSAIITLAHEFTHMRDSLKLGKAIFYLSYLFPQILFLVALIASFFIHPLFYFLILFLLPFPAPFRAKYELKGYQTTILITNEFMKTMGMTEEDRKSALLRNIESIAKEFTSSSYYFMWPFGVKDQLTNYLDTVLSGYIDNDSKQLINYMNRAKEI